MRPNNLSRRDFLKLTGLGLGALAFNPHRTGPASDLPQFPNAERLGRVLSRLDVRSAASLGAPAVKTLYEDSIVEWQREVVSAVVVEGRVNQRWVETPEGFIYSPDLQPVRNQPNTALTAVPAGKPGFWAEVTVPYVDLAVENAPASPWAKDVISYGLKPRLYYSQVGWIDQVRAGDGGRSLYRFNEDAGHGFGYGDIFWADGSAFRPLTEDDVSPINPDVDPAQKKVYINATYETLQCFEGSTEVYFCRVSSGAKWDAYGNVVDKWSTPLGEQTTWRKAISIHMSGGSTGAGFDTPAISWTTLFNPDGIAVHAAFWHNDFGAPRSHGCVNARPEDAKWIFRWTTPNVSLDQSDISLQWPNGGTHIIVDELRV
jgi:lipoprotein-anchoring transpeptidase ErfK/SrfK